MKEKNLKELSKSTLSIIVAIAITVLSLGVCLPIVKKGDIYQETISSIDNKKSNITAITLAADAASIAIAAIPGDSTSPIATKILDVTQYLVLAIGALVLEKALLTTCGIVAFSGIIPLACIIFIIYVLFKSERLKYLALKLFVFGLVVATIIPLSIKASDEFYKANYQTIQEVLDKSDTDNQVEQDEDENTSWFKKATNKIVSGTEEAIEDAKTLLNHFIDSVAILLITSCVIPIGTIALVLWLLKYLFGANIPISKGKDAISNINKKRKDFITQHTENQL